MIVLRSTYDALKWKYWALHAKHDALLREWNDLVDEINKKGGQKFLKGNGSSLFTQDDIKRLLMLCHPDKHDGKLAAVEMTQKLLKLRSQDGARKGVIR